MPTTVSLKFRNGNKSHLVTAPSFALADGDSVIVTTTRGKELAVVEKCNAESGDGELSPFVTSIDRLASKEDLAKEQELLNKRDEVLELARKHVGKCGLTMKLVDSEFTIDGQKVIISFVCDERVDFRDLVKELANALKMRIELKQIGSRDQAQLVGGIGPCGQVCCCIRYLGDFDKVSIKMAKTQNLSLNPAKISGLCGRLMCCLSYENDHYSETTSKMPKVNAKVGTPSGDGVLLYNNLLKQICTVRIEGEDTKIMDFPLCDVTFQKNNNNVPPCKANQNPEQ